MHNGHRNATLLAGRDDWETPEPIFAALRAEFGITLDVCALAHSAKVPNYLGPDHEDPDRRDALAVPSWAHYAAGGTAWMNPPYGKQIKHWMTRAHCEALEGLTVVSLVPSRTDAGLFHEHCLPWTMRFIRGRLRFGASTENAPFPSMVVVMGPGHRSPQYR